MVVGAFKFSGKVFLLTVIFMMFAKPSKYLVFCFVDKYIPFEYAIIFNKALEGEVTDGVFETTIFYASLIVNTIISLTIYTLVLMTYAFFRSDGVSNKEPGTLVTTFFRSTVLRIIKALFIMFIFWRLLELPPYEYVADKYPSLSMPIIIAVVVINALLTAAIYKGCTCLWRRGLKSFPSKAH
jgi:hypothetical protein